MNTSLNKNLSKTKILCTLGPATNSAEIIERLILAGMDGVRLNFSHANYNEFETLFNEIDKACVDEKTPLAILMDLQGPKIRIGELNQPEIEITAGNEIEITTKEILGTSQVISTSYKELPEDARVNDQILIDDGLIRLRIKSKKINSV
ncbi:MAG: pyruvate kinase, partial [Ignavibacteriaceae bacterium]